MHTIAFFVEHYGSIALLWDSVYFEKQAVNLSISLAVKYEKTLQKTNI